MKLLSEQAFSKTIHNKTVQLFTLKNAHGAVAQITNYGGTVVSLLMPDRHGNLDDVVLGYPTIEDYIETEERYLGALVGRCANRIANGKFTLEGETYNLAVNNGKNHLHGGLHGFDAVVWDVIQVTDHSLELKYTARHLEEGYPGNLTLKVRYELTAAQALKIEYWATTDQATPVNLTNHSFFNLAGAGSGPINDHLLQFRATHFTPINENLIPTGVLMPVKDTPLDFTTPTPIGERINDPHPQMRIAAGYDHNMVLDPVDTHTDWVARVVEPVTGRTLELFTNEPGVQLYTGNFLHASRLGKNEAKYTKRTAFCLETQHFPDSVNQPNFPSVILQPNEEYHSFCCYRFGVLS